MESMVKHFKVGDPVTWGSQSSGSYTVKDGIVVAVVPPGENATANVPGEMKLMKGCSLGVRKEESYLVQVDNKPILYWPRTKHLEFTTNIVYTTGGN